MESHIFSPLIVFVYGSLKNDYWNWPVFCSHAVALGKGYVPGRLWLRHTGTPILQPAEQCIVQKGTADLTADLLIQKSLLDAKRFESIRKANQLTTQTAAAFDSVQALQENTVSGEWMMFENGFETLRDLDKLEEFNPLDPSKSLYDRFLLNSPTLQIPVWAYGIPTVKTTADYRRPIDPHYWDSVAEGVPRDPKTGVFLAF
ncbi:MAG: hypothetical protein ACFCU1_06115 [Sumerlaeia bacterium]